MLELLCSCLLLYVAGAAAAGLWPDLEQSRRIANTFTFIGSLVLLAFGIAGTSGWPFASVVPSILPLAGGLALGLDRLSALFLIVIAVGVMPSTLYAIEYTRHLKQGRRGVAVGLNAFVPAMMLVVLSRNVLTFLVAWELMSLTSYFLVMTEHEREEIRSAGWLYLVMMHVGFGLLLIGFLTMAQATGSLTMSNWATALNAGSGVRSISFVLMAAGFLLKAGAIPFHVWLPRADPAAPSHISAIMSGVLVKIGIYGLIRIGFDWLGVGPVWWGAGVLVIGAMSALSGILYALVEVDLKRLLSYSTIENIGIILLGIGAALIFRAYGFASLAALALVAAVLHVFNHAIFKTLLFLGIGSVVEAAGTGNMEQLGGLLRRMPQTGAFVLIGSLAISAMPPFNGFISEWLMFQALLMSFRIPEQIINLVFALAIASLALTAGLAAACFVRLFGITFLALPRTEASDQARECGWTMKIPMAALCAACLVFGVVPALILSPVNRTIEEFIGSGADIGFNWSIVSTASGFSTITPVWVAVVIAVLTSLVWLIIRLGASGGGSRYYETWGCGRALQTSRFEYTAAAFSNPFKRVFAFLYRPVEETEIEAHPESRFFVKKIEYRYTSRSIIEDSIYAPVVAAVRRVAGQARALQSGNVHSYLLYILLALLVLLLLAK
jgi:hydrogenase-4 component B